MRPNMSTLFFDFGDLARRGGSRVACERHCIRPYHVLSASWRVSSGAAGRRGVRGVTQRSPGERTFLQGRFSSFERFPRYVAPGFLQYSCETHKDANKNRRTK